MNIALPDFIGKRKLRIYLYWERKYYSFCWLKFLVDGSFSFGFQTKKLQKIKEYGSAITKSGKFINHYEIIRRGDVQLEDIEESHITFHPPRINQISGIVHIIANKNKKVDEFDLDWFPVNRIEDPLYACSGMINNLEIVKVFKERHEIVNVPTGIQSIIMRLMLFPNPPRKNLRIDDPNAFANILGICPNYFVSCRFYRDNSIDGGLYIATKFSNL